MGWLDIIILGVALSLDAFVVAISLSLCSMASNLSLKFRFVFIVALFHAIMAMTGWAFGYVIYDIVSDYGRWLSFLLLLILGAKMLYDSIYETDNENKSIGYTSIASTLLLAIALSIDAAIVGLSFSLSSVEIFVNEPPLNNVAIASLVIALLVFIITWGGFVVGGRFSERASEMPIVGGILLILIAFKILISNLI